MSSGWGGTVYVGSYPVHTKKHSADAILAQLMEYLNWNKVITFCSDSCIQTRVPCMCDAGSDSLTVRADGPLAAPGPPPPGPGPLRVRGCHRAPGSRASHQDTLN
eukprot:3299943-Rhodomonas_salina.1